MNFFIYVIVILGAILGVGSTLAMIGTLFGTIGYKIYRKIKYHASLYD